ncbi:MAG: hypothetical protein WC389_11770 [Lutibacter sp.]
MTTWTGLRCTYCRKIFGILIPTSDAKKDLADRKKMGKKPCPAHDPKHSLDEVDFIQYEN